MSLKFDPMCQEAVDAAKRCVPEDDELRVGVLLDSLFYSTDLKDHVPQLGEFFAAPESVRDCPGQIPLSEELKPVFTELSHLDHAISADELFVTLVASDPGERELANRGITKNLVEDVLSALQPRTSWRNSPERRETLEALSSFGRVLTDSEPPNRGRTELEGPLKSLIMTLSKMKRRNAIVVGYAGTGKTALVYELARRIVTGHPAIPSRLRDYDIFELSPTFLRSGASVVGQYEERIKALVQVLTANPKVILFIDEIHSMFQSGVHSRGPFSDANETFKGVLGRGEIVCIGCTTLSEYRHYIEPDRALERRFDTIRVQPPSRETSLRILQARRPRMEEHFTPMRLPDHVLEHAVKLGEDYLPSRYEPDRSIQLIDQACAWMSVEQPERRELTQEAVTKALEHTLGHPIVRPGQLTEESVYEKLGTKIKGQDHVLHQIAKAFVTGLGSWRRGSGPRGAYLFGGPTGVGKTEVAQQLGRILGGDRDASIRVDCNLLQGSGKEAGPVRNLLLGVPPGYVGYARGQGGILSRVRDEPESVVLFDEFEKADPNVAELVLNIIDEGKAEDSDGNTLDFRRTFIVFTTNAGAEYDEGKLGFLSRSETTEPTVDRQQMEQELAARLGVGNEFLGRITHVFLFQGLTQDVIEEIVVRQLQQLRRMAELRGKEFTWKNDVAAHLAHRWQPRFGVRYLTAILRNRIVEQLGMAEAAGEFDEVGKIRLVLKADWAGPSAGVASRTIKGDTLYIGIA